MKRDFEIPPPFRGVSGRVGTGSSETRFSYQPARSPTKSKAAPAFVPVDFSPSLPLAIESSRAGLVLSVEGKGWPKNATIALGPHSPLFPPDTNLGAFRPIVQRLHVGVLSTRDAVWSLDGRQTMGACFVNGVEVRDRVELADGDLLEHQPPLGAPSAWAVSFSGARPPPESAWLTPLFAGALWFRDRVGQLEPSRAPLRLTDEAWAARWRAASIAGVEAMELVEPEDCAAPLETPHAQFPEAGWHMRALEWSGAEWLLRFESETWRWVPADDGLHERRTDGSLSRTPTPFFKPVLLSRERWDRMNTGFRLLPGPSPFLSGDVKLPAGPLSVELLGVFADQLTTAGDIAGPLLNDVILSTASAARSLDALLEPWATLGGTAVPPKRALHGTHVCGFFETLSLEPWRDFEKDLPILLRHPMLQRVRTVTLNGRGDDPEWCGASRVELLVEAARPFVETIELTINGAALR